MTGADSQRHDEIVGVALISQRAIEVATMLLDLLEVRDAKLGTRCVHVTVRRIVISRPVL